MAARNEVGLSYIPSCGAHSAWDIRPSVARIQKTDGETCRSEESLDKNVGKTRVTPKELDAEKGVFPLSKPAVLLLPLELYYPIT